MLDFVREKFRGFFIVGLWLWLILCVIGGGILGYEIGHIVGAIIGIILGILVGIFTNVLGGGLIATFIKIDENLETILNISKIDSFSDNKIKCPFCAEKIKREAIVCPFCCKNIKEYELELKTKVDENIKNMEEENKILFEVIDNVSLLKAASDTAAAICELIKGDKVYTQNMNKQFNYIYVTTTDGKKGWIKEIYIKQI